jgi:hypothetical protein
MDADPGEQKNLALGKPEKLSALLRSIAEVSPNEARPGVAASPGPSPRMDRFSSAVSLFPRLFHFLYRLIVQFLQLCVLRVRFREQSHELS